MLHGRELLGSIPSRSSTAMKRARAAKPVGERFASSSPVSDPHVEENHAGARRPDGGDGFETIGALAGDFDILGGPPGYGRLRGIDVNRLSKVPQQEQ